MPSDDDAGNRDEREASGGSRGRRRGARRRRSIARRFVPVVSRWISSRAVRAYRGPGGEDDRDVNPRRAECTSASPPLNCARRFPADSRGSHEDAARRGGPAAPARLRV